MAMAELISRPQCCLACLSLSPPEDKFLRTFQNRSTTKEISQNAFANSLNAPSCISLCAKLKPPSPQPPQPFPPPPAPSELAVTLAAPIRQTQIRPSPPPCRRQRPWASRATAPRCSNETGRAPFPSARALRARPEGLRAHVWHVLGYTKREIH